MINKQMKYITQYMTNYYSVIIRGQSNLLARRGEEEEAVGNNLAVPG